MSFQSFTKDPDATLDYIFDWTDYLTDLADTISSYTIIPDSGLTLVSSSQIGTTIVSAFVSSGIVGNNYNAVCRIHTTGGRIDERTITLKIRET